MNVKTSKTAIICQRCAISSSLSLLYSLYRQFYHLCVHYSRTHTLDFSSSTAPNSLSDLIKVNSTDFYESNNWDSQNTKASLDTHRAMECSLWRWAISWHSFQSNHRLWHVRFEQIFSKWPTATRPSRMEHKIRYFESFGRVWKSLFQLLAIQVAPKSTKSSCGRVAFGMIIVAIIGAGVAAAVYLNLRSSTPRAFKSAFSLEEVLEGRTSPRRNNASWISATELAYRDRAVSELYFFSMAYFFSNLSFSFFDQGNIVTFDIEAKTVNVLAGVDNPVSFFPSFSSSTLKKAQLLKLTKRVT